MLKKGTFLLLLLITANAVAQPVDYSAVSVPEESGIELTLITSESDMVAMPIVEKRGRRLGWYSNRIIAITPDGKALAFLSTRNNSTNVFVKDLSMKASSVQRTSRQGVLDFSYSEDGKHLYFTESQGLENRIYQTDAVRGFTCRQITSSNKDYSPIYASDEGLLFFCREEKYGSSIWSFKVDDNILSTYTSGINPYPVKGESSYLCARMNSEGRYEIWKVNYSTNVEECIITSAHHSFTTPMLSPDGQWILMVGTTLNSDKKRPNTDLFVCKTDGSQLIQLTYHTVNDISPAWSTDGKYIYFISQRGSEKRIANVWRMTFQL